MGLYLGNQNLTFGKQGKDGRSAYQTAKEQGYSGTEAEFGEGLARAVETQMLFGRFNSNLSWNDDESVYTETWDFDGNYYEQILTILSETEFTKELLIDGESVGIWTTIIDENSNTANTVYTAQ